MGKPGKANQIRKILRGPEGKREGMGRTPFPRSPAWGIVPSSQNRLQAKPATSFKRNYVMKSLDGLGTKRVGWPLDRESLRISDKTGHFEGGAGGVLSENVRLLSVKCPGFVRPWNAGEEAWQFGAGKFFLSQSVPFARGWRFSGRTTGQNSRSAHSQNDINMVAGRCRGW